MAAEPTNQRLAGVGFLNHISDTLDRCSGKWHWDAPFPTWDYGVGIARVRFLNTGRVYSIECTDGDWVAYENGAICDRLTGLLRGRVRDAAGNLVEVAK